MVFRIVSPLACLLALSAVLSASDTKPPTVPKGLTVVEVTETSVSLRWQASSDFKNGTGVAAYDVIRDGTLVGSTADLTYTDRSVASATTYQYAVRARDGAGNVSVPGTPVTATTLGDPCGAAPPSPTGLAVASVSSSAVTLSWTAVTPPVGCAVSYNVYSDSEALLASGVVTTAYTVGGLEPSTDYSFRVSAADSVGESDQSATATARTAEPAPPPVFPARVFAPYVDVLLYPTPSLSGMANLGGITYFSAGFIVAGSGCQATWGRHYKMSDGFLADDIAALRNQGGDIIASFGGAAGTELALACSTVESLQAEYRSVITTYGLTRLDFDIEGSALGNPAANDRRAKAIAALQAEAVAAGKTLTVQFTLPVMPEGLTADGLALLQNALVNGVEVGVVNMMAMDYGRSYDPNAMGQYAVDAMQATLGQLRSVYTGKPEADLRAMVGVTPMIGLNDVSPEVFTTDDAAFLVEAAKANGIGFLSFWSATRDQTCTKRQTVSPKCSGVVQDPWAFTEIFMAFKDD